MTRKNFTNDLKGLQNDLLAMGALVDGALRDALSALEGHDVQLAEKIIENDDMIDEMQIAIEDKCLMLIALQQPLATDLRILGTALKITIDLERMGDHAKNISEVTIEIGRRPLPNPLEDIASMTEKVRAMLKDALRAHLEMDIGLAESVLRADGEVDALCESLLRELLTCMAADSSTIGQASQFLYIARCLERAGDHASNIAECVVFLATGRRIK
ncbi:MAG: phosphate signaling complex protein PhoU [Acidaminococcales bacterium]|jgi:phosphate transport system protein|nr:phosphate signaling complex protein PhoU [Acidaminococcales bacterium]